MKRIIVLVLALALCLGTAIAESEWSGYSDDELQAMIDELSGIVDSAQAELDSRHGETSADGVRVPIGVWYVGEDIPEGHYTINVAPDTYMSWGSILVGTALDSTGKDIDIIKSEKHYFGQVKRKGSEAAVAQDELDYDFKSGDILIVQYADMVFTPYVKRKLGF